MHPLQSAVAAAPQFRGVLDALGGPAGLVGRLLGFGQDELRSGVPGWAWFVMGAAAGGVAVWLGRRQLERLLQT
jgi:hypothetical protein